MVHSLTLATALAALTCSATMATAEPIGDPPGCASIEMIEMLRAGTVTIEELPGVEAKVLAMKDVREVGRNADRLDCQGTALTTIGETRLTWDMRWWDGVAGTSGWYFQGH